MGLMAPALDALRRSAAAQLSSFAQVTLLNPKTRNLLLTMAAIVVTNYMYTTFNGRLVQVVGAGSDTEVAPAEVGAITARAANSAGLYRAVVFRADVRTASAPPASAASAAHRSASRRGPIATMTLPF